MDGRKVIFVMGWDVGEDGLDVVDGKKNWDTACLLDVAIVRSIPSWDERTC